MNYEIRMLETVLCTQIRNVNTVMTGSTKRSHEVASLTLQIGHRVWGSW